MSKEKCAMCNKKAVAAVPTEAGYDIPVCKEHDLKTLEDEEFRSEFEKSEYGPDSNMSELIEQEEGDTGE